jgi:heme oxygenase (biliverdin-IX-beta and delta-forming)
MTATAVTLIPPQTTGVMTRLCAETGDLQRRIELEGELLHEHVSWLDYRLYLFRMYGVHSPVERALGTTRGLSAVVEDAPLRNHKVALLAHDLIALGVDRRHLPELPRMPVPALHDLPEALGWMYVLESWTLGGRRLRKQLARRLATELESASAYLDCYGDEVSARWRELGSAVDRYADRNRCGDQIIAGAADCLQRLERWLRPTRYGR